MARTSAGTSSRTSAGTLAGTPAGSAATRSAAVTLAGVSKVYGRGPAAVRALDQVSLDAAPGEFICLIGASGCGKSTLLSLVAGLDAPTGGQIDVSGRVGLMFQEPGLFPWLTAAGNIELALRARGTGARETGARGRARAAGGHGATGQGSGRALTRAERKARARELLEAVHLGGFGGKRPHELSGGMRQRVALARALAQEADVLLMDEPFGALDAMTRDLLHDELDRIREGRDLTVLFVTHNVREAVRLGDRVVLLSSRPGRILAEYPVPIERPRRIDSAPVSQLAATITDRLREEVSRHAR
jgi:sulfonate transport system ATP-binding protein